MFKIEKLTKKNTLLVGYIGPKNKYNINLHHLGNNISILNKIFEGKHSFCTTINNFLKTDKFYSKERNCYSYGGIVECPSWDKALSSFEKRR